MREPQNPDIEFPTLPNPQAQNAASQVQNQALVTGTIATLGEMVGPNIAIASASGVNGVQVLLSAGSNTLTVSITGVGELASVKCNKAGGGSPTVNDDETQGYGIFSQWANGADMYVCLDATTGAAVWKLTT